MKKILYVCGCEHCCDATHCHRIASGHHLSEAGAKRIVEEITKD